MKTTFSLCGCLLGILLAAGTAQAQYTFGTAYEPTPPAAISESGGTFQYTNTSVTTLDAAYLPLTGTAATYISTGNNWTASVAPTLTARSMTATVSQTPEMAMGLFLEHTVGENLLGVRISIGQVNNSGDADDADYEPGTYGTGSLFAALTNGAYEATTQLGGNDDVNGASLLKISGGTNDAAATESIDAISGVVTLSYDSSDNKVTGYYNGIPVGSYTLTSWGSHPTLTLYAFGSSGEGIGAPAGTVTATNFSAGLGTFSIPQLGATQSGSNLILKWTTNSVGFTLQSSAALGTAEDWSAVTPSPAVVSGENTVTNATSGAQKFYRLSL